MDLGRGIWHKKRPVDDRALLLTPRTLAMNASPEATR